MWRLSEFSTRPASLRTTTFLGAFLGAGQEIQHFADGLLPVGRLRYGEMGLDLVAIPPTVLLLDDIAGLGEVGDDPVSVPLGDGKTGGDVAQPYLWVVRDAQEGPTVGGEEVPLSHEVKDIRNILLVIEY
jgi:hypothetical protein